MQIGNPLLFTVYIDSDNQILLLLALLFLFFDTGHPTGFRETSHSDLRWCPTAAGMNESKAA